MLEDLGVLISPCPALGCYFQIYDLSALHIPELTGLLVNLAVTVLGSQPLGAVVTGCEHVLNHISSCSRQTKGFMELNEFKIKELYGKELL